ncbi:hypothetical protein KIMH_11990 [Bombiscardovia apis]|uniref:DUF3152 domain-containing protein n=1 Tax=Bombiscardovia apis TaxID=2932182 RepID=A0ABN6SHE0_9BIFI|nr:DUF3152 domain-containing protein [Bombiscardovia apis]BDR55088.1 hypothetical protein KIMH_11990 [Bombiscardovia apis]
MGTTQGSPQSSPPNQHSGKSKASSKCGTALRLGKAVLTALAPGSTAQASETQVSAIYRIRRWFLAFLTVIIVVCLIVMGVSKARKEASSQASETATTSATARPSPRPSADRSVTAPPQAAQPQPVVLSAQDRDNILTQAQSTAAASGKEQHQFTYCIAGKGDVGDTTEFEQEVFRTLNDVHGWPRAGATFTQGSEGTCDMTVVLSQSQYMTTFSGGCSNMYSCRVGNQVIINKDRWDGGTEYWLGAGGNMARYKVMVINHEVGHRLGHLDNEQTCAGPGQPAPLMQEQSMGLLGCAPNEWPLDSELWVR